jgi:hypothetical protein
MHKTPGVDQIASELMEVASKIFIFEVCVVIRFIWVAENLYPAKYECSIVSSSMAPEPEGS